MDSPKSATVAVIELLGSSLWPLLALLAIFMFKPDVESLLTAASSQVQKANKFKVGAVDITISENALPKAPLRVSKIIPQIDNELMEYILATDPGTVATTCYPTNSPSELAVDGLLTRLQKMSLLTIKPLPNYMDEGKKCPRAVEVRFDELFAQVRTYYFDVLKQMKFTEAR